MNDQRKLLIRRLASDLRPVPPALSPLLMAGLWWLCTWVFVVAVTLTLAPLRPGALVQLATEGRFALESLVGLSAGGCLAVYAFADSIPGYDRRPFLVIGLGLASVWVMSYVAGLEYPAMIPSMEGKRAECFLETLLYSAPPALAGWWLSRRYYVLAPVRNTALLTLAAAMVPALFMQIACMYDPAHILSHHILPIPLIVALAAAIQWLWVRFT